MNTKSIPEGRPVVPQDLRLTLVAPQPVVGEIHAQQVAKLLHTTVQPAPVSKLKLANYISAISIRIILHYWPIDHTSDAISITCYESVQNTQ